jgi:hypothetical protein
MPHYDLASLRAQLVTQGYKIIPNRGKVPQLPGWNAPGYVERQLTDGLKGTAAGRVKDWTWRFPEALSTGLLICDDLVVIDIDVDDDALVTQLLARINEIAPDVDANAPTRFGGGEFKLALFCRLGSADAPFTRLTSRRYGEHCVEIFGSARLRGDKVGRQFGIYGPHSYTADGQVKATYLWSCDQPALHEVAAADLPVITRAQCAEIVDAFDTIATAVGLVAEKAPSETGTAIYDIDELTRFDTDKGGIQIKYPELCEQYATYGSLRCASNFIETRDGSEVTRCRVSWSFRHDCVAVWVDGDASWHYPVHKRLDPIVLGSALQEVADLAGVEIPPCPPNWRERFASGAARPSSHNAELAIEAAGIVCSEDTFHGRLSIDRGAGGKRLAFLGNMTDANLRGLRFWLSARYGLDFGEYHVREAALEMAHRNTFDPVLEMLAKAEKDWDGVPRLDRMAADYFNCEDTELNRQCVRKTMIAAVARVREPGCKFDTILTMESPEGWNKSTALRLLAGDDNFSDASIIGHGMGMREVQEQLAGIWIHENSELAGLRKAEVEAVKAFASRQEDLARPAYGRFLVTQPRHSIEVATTNSSEYLLSQTGNRRFWPIKILKPIDLFRLRRDRKQLWGEAAHYQSQDETLTLPEALWPAAALEQEQRRLPDPWEVLLAQLSAAVADGPMKGFGNGIVHVVNGQERVASAVIFKHVLEIPAGQLHNGHSKHLADCMRVLGWKAGVFKIDGQTTRGYTRKQIP